MADSGRSIRVIIAKPGLDGHETGAVVVARALRDEGMEVIYLGMRQTPQQIVSAAIEEDADVVGLSSLAGAHATLFAEVVDLLRASGADDVLVIGGGIIPPDDVRRLKDHGVAEIFGPGTTLKAIAEFIRANVRSLPVA